MRSLNPAVTPFHSNTPPYPPTFSSYSNENKPRQPAQVESVLQDEEEEEDSHSDGDVLDGYQTIKVSKLEKADRRDIVDLMVNTYKLHGALKVTKKALEKINRNDLVQSLSEASSGPEDVRMSDTVHLITGHLITGHLITGHVITGHLITGHLITGHLITDPALNRDSRPQNGSPEDKLFSIRKEFVRRVSKPVLDQLLDQLYQQKIIDYEEMCTARSHNTKANMARAVIDMAIDKGPAASSSLIEGLVSLDPTVSRTLGLK
ncbi:hypothetical protein GBF38_003617 [Nibea albiflora]|uniref:Uncharacterized protein n=1 Tax=Nibea albiflora TaxID=240163 RepID=A0ACB7FM62_NIBAL|nr:hypothetical protein GBF38_003617 [Nibea albiflora]